MPPPGDELERRIRALERLCDRDFSPLDGRIREVNRRLDAIVTELGGLHVAGGRSLPVRERLHSLEATEAGHSLVAAALKGRDHKLRDRLTLVFAGAAALSSLRPWEWLP